MCKVLKCVSSQGEQKTLEFCDEHTKINLLDQDADPDYSYKHDTLPWSLLPNGSKYEIEVSLIDQTDLIEYQDQQWMVILVS